MKTKQEQENVGGETQTKKNINMQNLSFRPSYNVFVYTVFLCQGQEDDTGTTESHGFQIDLTKPTERNTISRLESGISHDYNSAMTMWSTPKDTEGPLWSDERGSPYYRISFTPWSYHRLCHTCIYC